MQSHINELQDIVRKIVRQVLEWSEVRFKRITMSHDASDNPAEVYGANGKIYYRKEGGTGVELGGSEQSLWEVTAIDENSAVTPKLYRHIIEENVWIEDNGASVDSAITYRAVTGGGGGGHPIEEYI